MRSGESIMEFSLPTTYLCKEALNDNAAHTSQIFKCDLQRKTRECMTNKYEGEPKVTVGTAACLDPRFILNYSFEEQPTAVRQNLFKKG